MHTSTTSSLKAQPSLQLSTLSYIDVKKHLLIYLTGPSAYTVYAREECKCVNSLFLIRWCAE